MARIFISCSRQDEDEHWKDRMVQQLRVLAGVGLEVWDDRRIAAGDPWQAEIEQAMVGCDVALLLISAGFLTSAFILGQEVPVLLQRREREGMRA
jgi:TIR domain